MVSISAPVYDKSPEPKFLGTVALMVEVGQFVEFEGENPNQFAILVDWRKGRNRGLVLQHPKLEKLLEENPVVTESELRKFKVNLDTVPGDPGRLVDFRDPLLPEVGDHWMAKMAPVTVVDGKTQPDDCLMVVVQERYRRSIGSTLEGLKRSLMRYGWTALAIVVILMVGLWALVIRMFRDETAERPGHARGPSTDELTPSDGPTPSAPTEPLANGDS
jgi:hypothetical protein